MILEVSKKQDYIFTSKKLRENAERSGDIAYVTSCGFFSKVAGELFAEEENLVYSGGGHTVLQFDSPEKARSFAQTVTEAVLIEYEGLELFVKLLAYDESRSPEENLKALSRELERKKSLRKTSFKRASFGVETLDLESLQPMPVRNNLNRSYGQAYSGGMVPPTGWVFPTEFDSIAKEDNFISVIHIDGNAMGKRVEGVYRSGQRDWENCCRELRKFSQGIQRDFETTFSEMVSLVSESFPERAPDLPVRPIILAGDDVCFVTADSIGLECARIFLKKLSEKTNAQDGMPYAACAGVAMVHKKFPFHTAYDLAEEFCSNAKRFGAKLDPDGRACVMDWHIEFGQMKDSLAELRDDYRCDDDCRMELRPVVVTAPADINFEECRSYGFFRTLCTAMQENSGGLARGKVKEMREAIRQGEVETQFFLRDREISDILNRIFDAEYRTEDAKWDEYVKMLGGAKSLVKEPFKALDGEKRCLLFDAVEMMDHFEAIGEVRE